MDADPPEGATIEREEREDGRYVLYYSWPSEPGPAASPAPPPAERPGDE